MADEPLTWSRPHDMNGPVSYMQAMQGALSVVCIRLQSAVQTQADCQHGACSPHKGRASGVTAAGTRAPAQYPGCMRNPTVS